MTNPAPFLVLGLPRSRTFWLSRFLSYGPWQCAHEQLRHMRSLDDARSWLAQDFTGAAETAAAPWWRLARHIRPDLKILVVRRPVPDVVNSLMALDMRGVCAFDRGAATTQFARLDRYLDRISRQPDVLTVDFDDLNHEATCAQVFEHCLSTNHDPAWWAIMTRFNLQCDMPALARYAQAHEAQITTTAKVARKQMHRVLTGGRLRLGPVAEDGVSTQQESFQTLWRDGQALFKEHTTEAGTNPSFDLDILHKLDAIGALQIMTARCNGRLFGYLATIVSPSVEHQGRIVAVQQSFFVTQDFRGLGTRLQRASLALLRARNVDEVVFRAGVNGSGPRMGVLYRRMGAEEYGQLYNLKLGAA